MTSSSKTVRKLQVVTPVPADIDIANSIEPLHISEIAQELNLGPSHYDLYGKYKAKVTLFVSFIFIVYHQVVYLCFNPVAKDWTFWFDLLLKDRIFLFFFEERLWSKNYPFVGFEF